MRKIYLFTLSSLLAMGLLSSCNLEKKSASDNYSSLLIAQETSGGMYEDKAAESLSCHAPEKSLLIAANVTGEVPLISLAPSLAEPKEKIISAGSGLKKENIKPTVRQKTPLKKSSALSGKGVADGDKNWIVT